MADAKPEGPKVVIKSADMAEEMQHEAIEQAKKAMEEFHVEKVRAWPPEGQTEVRGCPPLKSAAAMHFRV